jgi:hypothetical protein
VRTQLCPALLEAGKIAHSMLFGVGDDSGYLWRSPRRTLLQHLFHDDLEASLDIGDVGPQLIGLAGGEAVFEIVGHAS